MSIRISHNLQSHLMYILLRSALKNYKEGGKAPQQQQPHPAPSPQQQQQAGAKRGQQVERNKNAQMLEEARRREAEASKEASKAQVGFIDCVSLSGVTLNGSK